MKAKFKRSNYIMFLILCWSLSACVSFDKGWNYMEEKETSENTDMLLKQASELEDLASTEEDVEKLISIYKKIEKADPGNYYALWKIGNYNLLMGAAHKHKKKEKKHYYREAIRYCEKAMFTNDDFKAAVGRGEDVVSAAKHLTINEVDAMGYWYTARFYYFKECMSPLRRIFNTKIVMENNEIIALIDKLDPNWAGGGNYFSRALYYIAVPERFGGSKEKAAEEFDKAIEVGPGYYVNRWGRAKYLYSLTGNQEGFISDLKWVVEQDPQKGKNPHAWNVYFQKDAAKMLEDEGVALE
ncbi:MAG: TRAP transporter TatT component family protein [Bacteroidales bacterium]